MRKRIAKIVGLAAGASLMVVALGKIFAQPSVQLTLSGGSTNYIPYEPPNADRVKFTVAFSDLTPGPDGKDVMKAMQITQFALDGKEQMVATAPDCVVDSKTHEFTSAGPLQVHAQDGRFFVEGKGFRFLQNESALVISNDAHSIIQNQSGTNGPIVNTEVFSKRARFEMRPEATNGSAVYEINVRVNDPRMQLTSEYLFAELAKGSSGATNRANSTNRLNHIVAETNVVMDFVSPQGERSHATSGKAVYGAHGRDSATNDVLELTEDPRVELTNGWMTADVFTVNRATGNLQGQDNFHFHYVPPTSAAKTNAEEADIYSDRFDYDLNTRLAHFSSVWSHVRVRDTKMKLDCETLTAKLPQSGAGENHFDHILAEKNVTMDFPDEKSGRNIHATAQQAVYDYKVVNAKTNELLELTGEPAIETAKPVGRMTADLIRLDRGLGKMWGLGNQHSVLKKAPDEPATMDTEVFSERFESVMDSGISVYAGGVRAYDPEMNLVSDDLTIKSVKDEQTGKTRLDNIVADGKVAIDFVDKAFSAKDITNLAALAWRLKQPGDFDEVAQYVGGQISPVTRVLLENYSGGTNAGLRGAITGELNKITQNGHVYDENRFDHVKLSPDTKALLEKKPLGIDLVQLNRLLLLDAFHGEIARREGGEKTHATGERAMYAYVPMGGATNQVLTLTGHPRLEKPDLWVTATDAIVYDRTTGESRYVGHPEFRLKSGGFTGLTPKSLGGEKKRSRKEL